MLNRIILIGRLTREPEMRYTTGAGKPVATFTIAVDRGFQQAGREKEADFIRIVCWEKLAETCKKYLVKGQLVAVEGRLQIRNWETPQGEKRTIAEVRADSVKFLDKPARQAGGGGAGASQGVPLAGQEYEAPYFSKGSDFPPETLPKESAKPAAGGKKDFGSYPDNSIDEEIELDDDEPF
ncbi:MAG TPA: single-stranded DNA-binding protein [bacterium]|nr:single-stranded DNA-binding protein [bacterium]